MLLATVKEGGGRHMLLPLLSCARIIDEVSRNQEIFFRAINFFLNKILKIFLYIYYNKDNYQTYFHIK